MKRTLVSNARDLRRRSTDAESKLWYHLRNRRLCGARFRRQKPIGRWIVDFYCAEADLIIEIDGGGHADPAKVGEDSQRTACLQKMGLRVLRFWNTDVLGNLPGVLGSIADALGRPSP